MKIPVLSNIFNSVKQAIEARKPPYIIIEKQDLVKAGLFTEEEMKQNSFQTLLAIPDIDPPSYSETTRYKDFYGAENTKSISYLPSYPTDPNKRPVYEEIVFEKGKTPLVTDGTMTYRIGAEHQEKFPDGRTASLQSMSVTLFETKDDPEKLYVFHCMQSKRVEEEWKIRAGMANVSFINPRKNLKSRAQCEAIIGTIMEIIKDVKTFSQAIEQDKNCKTADPNNLLIEKDTGPTENFSKLKSALKPVINSEGNGPGTAELNLNIASLGTEQNKKNDQDYKVTKRKLDI